MTTMRMTRINETDMCNGLSFGKIFLFVCYLAISL